MISSLAVVGILGNIPVLIVYFRRRDTLHTSLFIKVLAVIDLIVSALFMPYTIVYEFHLVTSDIVCCVCEFMRHCTLFISVITLVAVASERYFAFCKISTKINVNSINIGVWVIIVLAAIIAVPAIGTFAVVQDSDVKDIPCHFPHRYTSGIFCHFTYTLIGKPLVTAYQMLQAVISLLLIFIVTILYLIVYSVLWKRALIRRRMIERKFGNSETDFSSNASNEKHCRRFRCTRTSQCCGASSDPSYNQNSQIWSECINNDLNERESSHEFQIQLVSTSQIRFVTKRDLTPPNQSEGRFISVSVPKVDDQKKTETDKVSTQTNSQNVISLYCHIYRYVAAILV